MSTHPDASPHHRRRRVVRRSVVAAWIVGAAVAAVGLVGTVTTLALCTDLGVGIGALAGLEERMGLRFPPGTVLLQASYTGGMSLLVRAKLRMTHQQLEAFLGGPAFDGQSTTSERSFSNEFAGVGRARIDGWLPESAQSCVSAFGSYKSDTSSLRCAMEVMADLDDPLFATVYLVWYDS